MSGSQSKIDLMEQYVAWSNEAAHPDHIWTDSYVDRGLGLCNDLSRVTDGILGEIVASRYSQLAKMKETRRKAG